MNLNDRIAALKDRHDFLCDAYAQGMADGPDVEQAFLLLQAAKDELNSAALTTDRRMDGGG